MSSQSIGLNSPLHEYLVAHGVREDATRVALREETAGLEYSIMQISPEQGEFMGLLAKLMNAKRCIEVGTFTGYSALCVAQAVPDANLICCDVNQEWTDIATRYWAQAGVVDRIDLRLAPAVETLESLKDQAGTFDLIFIDADKSNYGIYYEHALKLLRVGGVVLVDNVLWSGRVIEDDDDADTVAIRELNARIADDERVDISMLPIGDGLTLAMKR